MGAPRGSVSDHWHQHLGGGGGRPTAGVSATRCCVGFLFCRYMPSSESGASEGGPVNGALGSDASHHGGRGSSEPGGVTPGVPQAATGPVTLAPRAMPTPLPPARLAPPPSAGLTSLTLATSQRVAAATAIASTRNGRAEPGHAASGAGPRSVAPLATTHSSGLVFLTPTERMLLVSCMDLDPRAPPAVLALSLLGAAGSREGTEAGTTGKGRGAGKRNASDTSSAVVTKGRIAASRSAVAVSLMGMHLLVCPR